MSGFGRIWFGGSVLVAALAWASAAPATLTSVTVNKCLSGKIKAEGKGAQAYLGCHAKGADKGMPTDAICLGKASTKLTTGFSKRDAKGGCTVPGDGDDRDADTASQAADVDEAVGHAGKCDAAKSRAVGKYVATLMGCYAKAANKPGTVDLTCASKAATKLLAAVAKAELEPSCSHLGQGPTLQGVAERFADTQLCLLSPGDPGCTGVCGDNLNNPGESCDASAPATGWHQCGGDFSCVACNCACPTRMHFVGDATDPATVLDVGWTGLAHRAPVPSNGDLTLAVGGCTGTDRPCGVCTLSGPIANSGTGELRNQRCSNDSSIQCTDDTPCTGGGGTCVFHLSAPLPISAGNAGWCVEPVVGASITGTMNVESGDLDISVPASWRVHVGSGFNTPCPTCTGDPTMNDGVQGGTCVGGARNALGCDGNAVVPGRPDFGTTSLDCPPTSGSTVQVMPIQLDHTTGTTSLAITTASPGCSGAGYVGMKCACDTCNNAAAEPCATNADCPLSGGNPGICGGRRCLNGANVGAPCANNTACPGGVCARPGEPTRPHPCIDDCAATGLCIDSAPIGDGLGECQFNLPTGKCSVASGHVQRYCFAASDCCDDPPACVTDPPVPGDCIVSNRLCFPANGVGQSIEGFGVTDAPAQDASRPTLASVFCVGTTSAPAINITAGLPGPARTLVRGRATGQP